MTTQQSDDDLIASMAHALRQRRQAALSWQTQAEQHEVTIQAQRGELERVTRERDEARTTIEALRNEMRATHAECDNLVARIAELEQEREGEI